MIDEVAGLATLALGSFMLLNLFVFVALDQFSRQTYPEPVKNPGIDDAQHLKETRSIVSDGEAHEGTCSTLGEKEEQA